MEIFSLFWDAVHPGWSNYSPKTRAARDLLWKTRIGSRSQKEMMGKLCDGNSGVTPELFQRYFEDFARGVDYIYERFGTQPDRYEIVDDGICHMYHDRDTKIITLFITREDIAEMCAHYDDAETAYSSKTDPYRVTYSQMVFLFGVEEAYHTYQFRTAPEKYAPLCQPNQTRENPNPHYHENIIEKEAETVVRQAGRELGFFNDSPPGYSAEHINEEPKP